MLTPDTQPNRALAGAINRRVHADASLVQGKAALWKFLGIGGLLGLAGAGVGAALFGYSYVTDNTLAADRIAAALTKSLNEATIKTDGTVKVLDGGVVELAKGGIVEMADDATVKLDNTAMIKIDPKSKIQAVGKLDVDMSQVQQASTGGNGGGGRTESGATITTAFTVFKSVPSSGGRVVSGWNFSPNDMKTPTEQYCYYTREANDSSVNVNLGKNGSFVQAASAQTVGLNAREEFRNCVWYR